MLENKIMPKVFGWMFIGLLATFFTGFYISQHEYAALKLLTGITPIIIIIVELGLAVFLTARINKMSPTTAKIAFLAYSVVSGITFSSIFIVYKLSSIMFVFLITAILFGLFAFFGYVTNMDLTKLGTYFIIGIFGCIICSVVNIFMHSQTFDLLLSVVFILLFVGVTAYDVQKIKYMESNNIIPIENLPIYGALQLYLDFINIFIKLLRIFGKRND